MENLNIKINERGGVEKTSVSFTESMARLLFEPSDSSFCSNETIKNILLDKGCKINGYEVSKYLKSISRSKVIKRDKKCIRGFMVKYIG